MMRTKKGERGFTFIEVLVALAILGIIAAAFLFALASSSKSVALSDERTAAESLARTEMEYVKNSVYVMASWGYELPDTPPSWDPSHTLPAEYSGFTVTVSAAPLRLVDDGIQSITITVSRDGKDIFSVTDYKVNRNA